VGAELFYADGRTDMTKLTVAFHNFATAPKELVILLKTGVGCSTKRDLAMTLSRGTIASTYLGTPPRLDLTFPLALMFTAVQTLSRDVTSIHGVINC
jgi:hypothetical protein